MTLAERNESAIVQPDAASSRVAVLYWKDQSVDHADFAAIASVAEGQVIRLTEAAALRLRTMLPLQFGDVEIGTENLAQGFPGSYGLWLKRVDSGWRLVFNNEPDVWGTQYDPVFDAAGDRRGVFGRRGVRAHPRRGARADGSAQRAVAHPLGLARLEAPISRLPASSPG